MNWRPSKQSETNTTVCRTEKAIAAGGSRHIRNVHSSVRGVRRRETARRLGVTEARGPAVLPNSLHICGPLRPDNPCGSAHRDAYKQLAGKFICLICLTGPLPGTTAPAHSAGHFVTTRTLVVE